MTRIVLTLAFAITALGCTKTTLDPSDGGVAELDGGDPSQPGSCFEIFPHTEWTLEEDPQPHRTPTVFALGEVPVGTAVEVYVGYYNFCGTPAPGVQSADWVDAAVDPAFEVLEVPDAVDSETMQSPTRLRLTPSAVGEYSATFRLQFRHGYYDIVISATGVEPA